MPAFDVAGARKAGYDDKEILSYVAGEENPDLLPGTDAEKIRLLLARNGKHMLDVEYLSPTQLEPMQEVQFQDWAKRNKVRLEPGWNEDYDMRGLWKANPGAVADPRGHWPDTYKLPNHPTFSNQSVYATDDAPRWYGKRLIDSQGKVIADESDSPLDLPDVPALKLPQGLSGPPASVPGSVPQTGERRNMTPSEVESLWQEPGLQPTLPPMSLADMAMLPMGAMEQESGIPLSLLAMAKNPAGKRLPPRRIIGEGALTGENVLRAAERLQAGEGIKYGPWRKENPDAGATLFDLATAKPAGVFPPGPLPRTPVGRADIDRTVAAFRKPKVVAQLQEWINAGMQKMPDSWYRTGPLYDEYVKEWGPELAPAKMQKQLEYIAATSTSAKVPDNLKIGSLYNYLDQQGLPIPESGPPKGYGHKFWMSHRDASKGFREGTFNPLDNPKRASYVQNLGGNENVVTADRHYWRALGMASGDPRFLKTRFEKELPDGTKQVRNLQKELAEGKITMRQAKKEPQWWDEAPRPNEYGYAEDAYKRKVTDPMGLTVGQGQEKQWVGASDVTGLGSPGEPILRTLGSRIAYTAYQMGTTPEKVLQAYVQGKIPLLELGAGAVGLSTLSTLAGLAASGDEKQREKF